MDRFTFWAIVCAFLVCFATRTTGEFQQFAPGAPNAYTVLRGATLTLTGITSMNKMIVKVIPLTSENQEFAICLGYEYSTSSTNVNFGLKKYVYSLQTGNMTTEDIPIAGIVSFRDFTMFDKGDGSCKLGILEEVGNFWKVGGPAFSSTPISTAPHRAALTKPDYSVADELAFFCNITSCHDDEYNQVYQAVGSTISGINVANIGVQSYLAAISLSPSGGVKNAPILRYVSGLWSPFLTANPARDVSVTSWDDNDYMLCYDNGAISIENSPSIYCRSKDGASDFVVDNGAANAANATFSQVTVSPVSKTYALVSALATNNGVSHFRLFGITKGASAALDPRTLFIGGGAQKVASYGKGGIIALAVFGGSNIVLTVGSFDPTVFAPAAPLAAPLSPLPSPVNRAPDSGAPVGDITPRADTPSDPVVTPVATPNDTSGLSVGAQAGIGVAVGAAGLGAGLFVLLFMLKKKRDKKKKQQSDETPMDPADGIKEGSDGTYGNLPGIDSRKYSNINLTNGKYSSVEAAGGDDGIAVPISIQPSEIDKRMHLPYKSLVFVKEIGAGSYGKVYLGEWRGAKVAIKVNNTVTDVDGFLAEAKLTLGITPHPNLVQTFGVSLDGPNPCIVLEYCGGGSLDQLFTTEKGLTNEKKLEYALKIGFGLGHLHSRSIVHRDLAARNILLTNDGQPKISDFGMSRIVQEEAAKGKTKTNFGPIRWMAPENLKDKTYSLKSDVWSFGIILFEMVTGKEPHEDADQLEIALKIRDKGVTPEIPEDCDPVLRECMEMCWKFNPSDRPSIEEVCAFIRSKTNIEI